jgi:hypothetical protein
MGASCLTHPMGENAAIAAIRSHPINDFMLFLPV